MKRLGKRLARHLAGRNGVIAMWIWPAGGAVTTYYPNSANCTAYYTLGQETNRPPTAEAMQQEFELSAAEKNTISTDDANYHEGLVSGNLEYPGHRVRYQITEAEGNVTQLVFTDKGYGKHTVTLLYEWYSHVRNYTAGAYQQQQFHTQDVKATLTTTIAASWPDYINVNILSNVLQGPGGGTGDKWSRLYFAKLEVTA